MSEQHQPPTAAPTEQQKLQKEIQQLQQELAAIERKKQDFGTVLRGHISDLIIEEQELFVLYKQIKKAKKNKRLEQKKRGKNYKESTGVSVVTTTKKTALSPEEQQERKRLYREAILHVHPDKFSMSESATDLATEVASRLIEIYKTGTLESLRAYHAHIFKGNTAMVLDDTATKIKVHAKDNYWQQEKEALQKAIATAKNHQLYRVLTDYPNPLTFVDELKAYYEDRITKLKKRTRKGL